MQTVNVLGTEYTIEYKDFKDDANFGKYTLDAYCDSIARKIVIGNHKTFEGYENETDAWLEILRRDTIRHEIIHAFLNESGLQECSSKIDRPWAKNEEMVDWVAIQFPKILKVYQELDIL